MPIYKMKGSKDGKGKYRVRINYQDALGKYRQIDRVYMAVRKQKKRSVNCCSRSKTKPRHSG